MLYLLSSSRFYIFSARCRHPALDAGSKSKTLWCSGDVLLICAHPFHPRHPCAFPKAPHHVRGDGLRPWLHFLQRLVVSGKRLVLLLAVRMAFPPAWSSRTRCRHPALDAGSKSKTLWCSGEVLLIRAHPSHLCHLRAFLSSRVKHGMTACWPWLRCPLILS